MIDKSEIALSRAKYFCERVYNCTKPMIIEADLNLLDASTIPQSNSSITMHFFANILDILDINIFNIISAMEATQGKKKYCNNREPIYGKSPTIK